MSYLARLKQLDRGTEFSPHPETVPTELTQSGFVSSVGSIWRPDKKIHGANDDRDIRDELVSSTTLHGQLETDAAYHSPVALRTMPDSDDRRFCKQCQNLKGSVCGVAGPGMLVSARQGYQPILDVPHRCSGYFPNTKDFDQRTGGERWPQLI